MKRGPHAEEGRSAEQDLRRMRAAVHLAQEMGTRLGECPLLFRPLPGQGVETGLMRVGAANGAKAWHAR